MGGTSFIITSGAFGDTLLHTPQPDRESLVANIKPFQHQPGISLGLTDGAEDGANLLPAHLAAFHVHLDKIR